MTSYEHITQALTPLGWWRSKPIKKKIQKNQVQNLYQSLYGIYYKYQDSTKTLKRVIDARKKTTEKHN